VGAYTNAEGNKRQQIAHHLFTVGKVLGLQGLRRSDTCAGLGLVHRLPVGITPSGGLPSLGYLCPFARSKRECQDAGR
jgi:hypothetical protein